MDSNSDDKRRYQPLINPEVVLKAKMTRIMEETARPKARGNQTLIPALVKGKAAFDQLFPHFPHQSTA